MISLNIKADGKIQTKSFTDTEELSVYLQNDCGFIFSPEKQAKKIWNLQVAQSINIDDFVFSVRTKQRQTNPVSGVLEWR